MGKKVYLDMVAKTAREMEVKLGVHEKQHVPMSNRMNWISQPGTSSIWGLIEKEQIKAQREVKYNYEKPKVLKKSKELTNALKPSGKKVSINERLYKEAESRKVYKQQL